MTNKDLSIRRQTPMSASAWLFVICFLVYSTSYIARGSFSFVRSTMLSDGAISIGVAGAISAAYFIFYAVGQLVNGFLGDRISPFLMVIVGLGIVVVSNVLMTVAQPQWFYVLWWGINGYGHSMLWSPVFFVMSNMINTRMRIFALTAISICSPFGKIMSALVSSAAISDGKWQKVFFVVSLITVAVLLVWVTRYVSLKGKITLGAATATETSDGENLLSDDINDKEKKRGIFSLLVASGVIIMLPAMLVHGLFYNGVVELIPTILSDQYNMSASMAAIIDIIIPVMSIVGLFFANLVYYKIFKKNDMKSAAFLMTVTLVPVLIMLVLAIFKTDGYMIGQYPDAVIFVVIYALVYLLQFAFNHVVIVLLASRFAKYSYAATLSGLANAINYGGSAISTYGMTYALLKLELWQTVIIWGAVLIVAAILVILSMGKWSKFAKEECFIEQD